MPHSGRVPGKICLVCEVESSKFITREKCLEMLDSSLFNCVCGLIAQL